MAFVGAGADQTVIRGNGTRVLNVGGESWVILQGLTLAGGNPGIRQNGGNVLAHIGDPATRSRPDHGRNRRSWRRDRERQRHDRRHARADRQQHGDQRRRRDRDLRDGRPGAAGSRPSPATAREPVAGIAVSDLQHDTDDDDARHPGREHVIRPRRRRAGRAEPGRGAHRPGLDHRRQPRAARGRRATAESNCTAPTRSTAAATSSRGRTAVSPTRTPGRPRTQASRPRWSTTAGRCPSCRSAPTVRPATSPERAPAPTQRDVPRPQGALCDAGAYEYVAPPPVEPTPTPTAIPTRCRPLRRRSLRPRRPSSTGRSSSRPRAAPSW